MKILGMSNCGDRVEILQKVVLGEGLTDVVSITGEIIIFNLKSYGMCLGDGKLIKLWIFGKLINRQQSQ